MAFGHIAHLISCQLSAAHMTCSAVQLVATTERRRGRGRRVEARANARRGRGERREVSRHVYMLMCQASHPFCSPQWQCWNVRP